MKDNYPITFKQDEDGSYFVWYEDLPGCMADGPTLEDAIRSLQRIRKTYLALAKERGIEIPKPEEISCWGIRKFILPRDLAKKIISIAQEKRLSKDKLVTQIVEEWLEKYSSNKYQKEDKNEK